MSNFEESCSIVNSLATDSDQGREAEFFGKHDTISTGESKFKNYTFKQNFSQSPEAIKKCVDFWAFIDGRTDLIPQRGFTLGKKSEGKSPKEPNASWNDLLTLLKAKKLDKLVRNPKKVECNPPSCSLQICPDDFEVTELNDFDPQRIALVDVSTQTDEIHICHKAVQTDETPESVVRRKKLAELDQLLKAITDELTTGSMDEMVCICNEASSYSNVEEQSSDIDVLTQSESVDAKDACTCSCGEVNCLCSLCVEILEKISKAQTTLKNLSLMEIKKCSCSNIACDCLYDYNKLLNTKLEINRIVQYAASNIEAQSYLLVKCECPCGQVQCPCSIILQLLNDLNNIIGGKPDLKSKDEDAQGCTRQEDFKYHNCLTYFYSQINKKLHEVHDTESQYSSASTSEELLKTCSLPKDLCLCITDPCSEKIETVAPEMPLTTSTNPKNKTCNCQEHNCDCLDNQ